MKLHDETAWLHELEQELETKALNPETGEVLDEALYDALATAIKGVSLDADKVIEALALRVDEMKVEEAAQREEYRKLRDRADRTQRNTERLKAYLMFHMNAQGKQKVKGLKRTVSISAGRESVNITDENSIPPLYQKYVITIDKKALGEDLKAGHEIPGAELIRNPFLSIRG